MLSLLPNRIRQILYYRYFHTRHDQYPHLFEAAALDYAPGTKIFDLIPGDIVSGNLAFTGFYELDLTRRLTALAKKGGLLVDVGANMGYFSLLWAGINRCNRAYAIEAAPRNTALLKENIRRNGFEEQITLIPKAAGDRNGEVQFALGPTEQTGWGGISDEPEESTITVPLVRIDELLPELEIDVLKVDVEGADTLVLYGCEALLKKKKIKTIFYEQNRSRMAKLKIAENAAREFLEQFGYSCHSIDKDGGEWIAVPNGD